jgi:hypothetical protein
MPVAHAQSYNPEMITNGPQATPNDMGSNWSARRNVIESRQYERLLQTNSHFRQARMQKECGPITDPELHQSCMASFGQGEPMVGSSNYRGPDRNAGY